MGSVTVYSSAKVDTLIADSVVDIDLVNSKLILTKRNGSTVDAGGVITTLPDATDTGKGLVEIATDTETRAGTDSTRAVSPFGLASVVATSSLRGLVELATDAETATGTDTTRAITPANLASLSYGSRLTALEGIQVTRILPATFTQSTAYSSYPAGESLMFLSSTEATTGSWSFAGKDGVLTTYRNGTNILQRWQRFGGNTNGTPELWLRNGNASGWSAWIIAVDSSKLPDPQTQNINNSVVSITATTWTNVTGISAITLNMSRDAIVTVELNSWLTANYVDATSLRAGVSLDGAAPETLFGGNFGQVLYETSHGTTLGSGQHGMSATGKLTAGSHSFTLQALKTGTGGTNLGYPVMRITPLRWAE